MCEREINKLGTEEINKVVDRPLTEQKPLNKEELISENISNRKSIIQYLVKSYEKYNILSILVAIISILTILIIAVDECRQCFIKLENKALTDHEFLKKFWVYGKNVESGYLKEVFTVLDRLGYRNDPNSTDWDLLWAHDYPFRKLYQKLNNLKPHQKVNHFPGCGYITNKVDLATSGLKYIPPAFKLPVHKDKLLEYSKKYPNVSFVQKNNDHRNIKIQKIDEIDLDSEGTFVQEYVDKPLLVNGHKFDIGIYTVITSVDPLRIYIYNGEALLRFCPVKYYPFDPENLDKYVVGDDYLPTWEVPALDYYYNELGFGMRDSLNAYLQAQGKNPAVIWEQIEDSIRTVIIAKEPLITDVLKRFKSKRNFFEMMRFDFVLDENLKIYLLEANMSPNLSSAHFPPNRLLYQQVLYNILGSKSEEEMLVSDKNIASFPKKCNSNLCRTSCVSPDCQLCKPCLSPETRQYLVQAFKEHLHRGD
ncbi:hypothetical protein NQ314_021084, partial [Rhamnusium bicolor]